MSVEAATKRPLGVDSRPGLEDAGPAEGGSQLRVSKNAAMAGALLALAVLLYAVSLVRTREAEERRHRENPQAHAAPR